MSRLLTGIFWTVIVFGAFAMWNRCGGGGDGEQSEQSTQTEKVKSKGSASYYQEICQGKTADEVVELFGAPDLVDHDDSDFIIFTYWYDYDIIGEYGQDNDLKIVFQNDTKMFHSVMAGL